MIGLLSFLLFTNMIFANEIASYIKTKYENVTLYDIAPNLVNKTRGEEIILGKIKVPGGKLIIKGDRIKAELTSIGINNQKVPSSVTVERSFVEKNTKLIEEELLKVLNSGKNDFDYNISISTRDTLRMPLGKLVFKVQEGIIDKLGKKNMKALVYEDTLLVYEFPFTLSTGKIIKEYTLIRDVEKGEKFDLSQVSVKSELVHEENKLKNVNISEDTIYSEKLLAGTKLEDKHIESNSSVKKGDKIAIVVSFGTMKITDKGEALQKGNMGDLIEVKNLRTGKTLKGTVISKDTVEIAP